MDFSHRFVITDSDLLVTPTVPDDSGAPIPIERLYEGFDPEASKVDRRLLYEVTGKRLRPNEFQDSDTSNE